jgi:leucyl aminopeptidase (aminopeptidase T)
MTFLVNKPLSNQRGMSMVGLVLTGAIVFSLIILAVKIVPAYIEYASVKKLMYKIGHESNFDSMSNEEIAKAFDAGANISYISSVKSTDLTIYETDQKIVAAEYQVVKPLVANISLVMKFKATTEH